MYFPKTLAELERRIKTYFPDVEPKYRGGMVGLDEEDSFHCPEHLLYMIEEVKKMDDYARASRWIGWILCELSGRKIIALEQTKYLVRSDARAVD